MTSERTVLRNPRQLFRAFRLETILRHFAGITCCRSSSVRNDHMQVARPVLMAGLLSVSLVISAGGDERSPSTTDQKSIAESSDDSKQEPIVSSSRGADSQSAEHARPNDSNRLAASAQKIFAARCLECHGQKVREGGFRLLGRRDLFRRNDSGEPAVVAGKPDASELLRRVTSADESERMPPEGEPLDEQQVRVLREWIAAGAALKDVTTEDAHWAYQRVERPVVPAQDRALNGNAIDAFVLRKLNALQSAPAPQAEPSRLIRRLYLDLTGVPPSPEQVAEFERDPSPASYERIVDRLLASDRYGERWAQLWLDLARYADSNGYQADQFREMWAYRDWVIDAFNSGMPFDQFTTQQLAGDIQPEADLASRIATGFHRCTTCNVEAGVDPEENRVNQIFDRVNTTSTVWLGTTMECAQCHNHKYDPFTQQDYYQLFAFFNSTPIEVKQQGTGVTYEFYGPKMDVELNADQSQKRKQLDARIKGLEKKKSQERKRALARLEPVFESLTKERTSPEWKTIEVIEASTTGGATTTLLEDGSVLVSGARPDKDTYVIRARIPVRKVRSIRLSALTDDSLPGKGPGRHDPERPNFVLNEFSAYRVTQAKAAKPQLTKLDIVSATADFSQSNFDVQGAVDDDLTTAWAINPQFHKPHFATFGLAGEELFDANRDVEFRLVHNYGGCRTIGRVRIEVSASEASLLEIPENVRKAALRPQNKRTEAQRDTLLSHFSDQTPEYVKVSRQIASVRKQLEAIQPPTTLVMTELGDARETHIMKRGDFLNTGAAVEAKTPEVLPALSSGLPRNRLGLAQWIVSRDNPLTARVTVNRWWASFFGHGIVASQEDFGTQGDRPTHPELLDWLAVEFMESGWSMKHVHKLIVMSSTYQQSARVSRDALESDPYNDFYARGPRNRMSAEMIRDNALAVSGLLSDRMHGPPVYPPQPQKIWRHIGRNAPKYIVSEGEDRFRRGVYVVWRRSAPYASFVNFDAPDRASCVVQRSRTNTPLQALNLMNDEAYNEMAQAMARSVVSEASGSVADRMRLAFRRTVARKPKSAELLYLMRVLEEESEQLKDDEGKARKIAGLSEEQSAEGGSAQELAAWTILCSLLLNLDETVTK